MTNIYADLRNVLSEAGVFVDEHMEESLGHLTECAETYLKEHPETETLWDVTLTREATESTTVRVSALDEEDAESKALEAAGRCGEYLTGWETDEGNSHDVECVDPENLIKRAQPGTPDPQAKAPKYLAEVGWDAEDVIEIASNRLDAEIPPDEAAKLLEDNEDEIQTAMIDCGERTIIELIEQWKEDQDEEPKP